MVPNSSTARIAVPISNQLQDPTYFVFSLTDLVGEQHRGAAFLAQKYRFSSSIEGEIEAGGFLGEKDWGGQSTLRAYLDFQAVEMKAELRANAYKLKEKFNYTDAPSKTLAWRTSGRTEIIMRGIGYLPSASELKLDASFQHDAGPSHHAVEQNLSDGKSSPQFITEGELRFDSSVNANPWLQPYVNFPTGFDLIAKLNWYLSERTTDQKSNDLPKSWNTNRWLQTSFLTSFVVNPKHELHLEPTVRFSNQPNADFKQIYASHKWNLSPIWQLSNRLGFTNFDNARWNLSYEPKISYFGQSWSGNLYLRATRSDGNWATNKEENLTTYQSQYYDERAVGAAFKFYTYGDDNQSIDLALTAEYNRFGDGSDDKQFGIKLDISD